MIHYDTGSHGKKVQKESIRRRVTNWERLFQEAMEEICMKASLLIGSFSPSSFKREANHRDGALAIDGG